MTTRSFTITTCAVAFVCLVLVIIRFWPSESDASKYQRHLRLAKRAFALGHTKISREECDTALAANPEGVRALILSSKLSVERKEFERAVEELTSVISTATDSSVVSESLLRLADIQHYEIADLDGALRTYRSLLDAQPDDLGAHAGIARLYGLAGRLKMAVPHILQLIKSSRSNDLLVLLAREKAGASDPALIQKAIKRDPRSVLGNLSLAHTAALEQNFEEALSCLRKVESISGRTPEIIGKLGLVLLDGGSNQGLKSWFTNLPAPSNWSAETWFVVGQISDDAQDRESAIRCYWETLQSWPESLGATNRMAQLLQSTGRLSEAQVFQDRVNRMNTLKEIQQSTVLSEGQFEPDRFEALLLAYADCGRYSEAIGWIQYTGAAEILKPDLIRKAEEWTEVLLKHPEVRTAPFANPALQMDLRDFPVIAHLPDPGSQTTVDSIAGIQFREEASGKGFNFEYFNGAETPSHRMFEFTGGGIGIIDFDSDSRPDIICTQGQSFGSEPSSGSLVPTHQPGFFRNRLTAQFEKLPDKIASPLVDVFGQGVAVGDVDTDGFPDVMLAGIRQNILLTNNGDGTFTETSLSSSPPQWSTSCAIADLNGDTLPDVYVVNYLDDIDVFDRLCEDSNGNTIMCTPRDFPGAVDQVLLNDGEGNFRDGTLDILNFTPDGKGLGIHVSGRGNGKQIFVANDTVENHFLISGADSEDGRPFAYDDLAVTRGTALNGDGKAEACMGIAAADINNDGQLDYFVTNFLHESNTLYQSVQSDFFLDQTRTAGLHSVSLPVLGFGAQFLDANLDGQHDLFVANGYTEDLADDEVPFAMRPQVFVGSDGRFTSASADSLGPWASEKIVGRSVAVVDWNLDSKPDLCVGTLLSPYLLLTNDSSTQKRGAVTLRCIGVAASRDAVGTVAKAIVGGQERTFYVTSGDGYQCSNERVIRIADGGEGKVANLRITWPSGNIEVFDSVASSGHYIVVEGQGLYEIPR